MEYSAKHWTDCFVLMFPIHEEDRIMNKVYAGELPSSPPAGDPQEGAMKASMDTEPDE